MALARSADRDGEGGEPAEASEITESSSEDTAKPVASRAGEADLVAAVLSGEVDRYRVLVLRYQGRLLSTLHRLVGDRHVAEELAQQSFVDAFDALARFDRGRSFSTWLFRIAINNGKDWLKSHKRRERPLPDEPAGGGAFGRELPDPERAAITAETLKRLEAALAELPVEYREVVVLKDVQQLSYQEIHEILGHPITTLKIRAVRGRAALRKALDSE